MTFRPPASASRTFAEASFDALGHEILAEKAAALGRAGERAELSVKRLREFEGDAADRMIVLRQAVAAVYAYFVQRELCGMCRHDEIIRDFGIPKEVIARLGSR